MHRRLFRILGTIALIYGFFAGLRTVADPDLPWQMASGRWIVQHHELFSTDVFSYTASGTPWVYPAGSELLFYGIYRLGGFVMLSWLGALACVGTVAILLRRGSALTAAIAIVVIPLIADRTVPRAEMFSVLLFAAYLSLLWENFETGRARLWLLPLLMIAWVNLHLGFVAGFALIAGFVGIEILECCLGPVRRSAALQRCKHALAWYGATALATLVNPWGWNVFGALARQNRAMAAHSQVIVEWASAHWSWFGSLRSFSQEPVQFTIALMALIVVITGAAALLQLNPAAAILLGGGLFATLHYVRMEALTACVVVVVGGAVLTKAASWIGNRITNVKLRTWLAVAATVAIAFIGVVRVYDYTSDHLYLASDSRSSFGAGLSWWFPKAATEFILQQNLPPNIFNTFNEGGYVLWATGERYRDYMDGRAVPFGTESFERERELLGSPIDSMTWQQEADKHDINTILLHLASGEIGYEQLQDLCYATNWKPVYLDEISMVLVRRTPQTEPMIQQLQVSCPIATVPAAGLDHSRASFSRWLKAAYVLLALRRTNDALAAADIAQAIFPDSASLHWVRGNILYSTARRGEAEKEWLKTLALSSGGNDAAAWSRLAQLYTEQGRRSDAMQAWQNTARLTTDVSQKTFALGQLARLDVADGKPQEALQAWDEAARTAPVNMSGSNGHSFAFEIAQSRAAIWLQLGDGARAISFLEEAVRLEPNDADTWSQLAKLYQRAGRAADQQRAEQRVQSLTAKKSNNQ